MDVLTLRTLERAQLVIRRQQTLGDLMERLARVHGDRPLVDEVGDDGLQLTYRQAAKRVARWAGGIRSRIEPGDRVVIAAPNGYEFFLLCMAASRAGGVPVPLNTQMRPDEVRQVVADCSAALVVRSATEVDGAEPVRTAPHALPHDVAALFYTSGTTGSPKGARLTHQSLVGQLAAAALYPSWLRHDTAVISLPVAHIMGFTTLAMLATAGVTVRMVPQFRPDVVLDVLEESHASMFVGVPAMYRMMLEAGAEQRNLRSVRLWVSGADVMPDELARRFQKMGATFTLPIVGTTLGEAMFAEGYGMVEVGGGVAAKLTPPFVSLPFGDALGWPLPGYELRVVDDEGAEVGANEVGELWIRGPGVLRGYHGDADRTAEVLTEDGWLRTGDLARRGRLGLVRFAGRQKDVILCGGYTVYAVEIEQALERHPEVSAAGVVAAPDDRLGEVPVAAVELVPGSCLDGEALTTWAHDRLAEYKAPRQVLIVEELPRTATRKVSKVALRELLGL